MKREETCRNTPPPNGGADKVFTDVNRSFVDVIVLPIFAPPAGVVELVDTPDLGSGAARRGGSSPFARTF